jgi:hypothetical protein
LNSFYRRRQHIAYGVDVLIFGQLVSAIEEVIQIKEAAVSTVLLINPLNTKLNPFYHLLALLGAHHILHISRVRVNASKAKYMNMNRNMTNLEQDVTMNRQVLEGV